MKKFIAYLRDDSGQTSTEYILLVAVVAIIVFKFKNKATEQLGNLTDSIFSQANTGIQQELSEAFNN